MAKNSNLHSAKRAKLDEFYTQWADIEKEMNAYLDYNPDVFRGKTILLPCDDPDWSNFTKFFALRFQDYGIKKLISTSYAPKSNMEGKFYEPGPSLFYDDQYDEEKDYERGKIFVLDGTDLNDDGRVNIEDFAWKYLEGDGDFRSDEIKALRDEANMIITNPPFSLFREFVEWLVEGEVEFSIIGSMNAITYKEIFPLIRDNKMWLGRGKETGGNSMWFEVPKSYPTNKHEKIGNEGSRIVPVTSKWFTNIQHGRRHEPLPLMTMEDNLRYNKKIIKNPNSYKKYDNYNAIEVPATAGIPEGYTEERWVSHQEYEDLIHNGFHCEILEEREREILIQILNPAMGVPISFLDKYSPEQFEIVGLDRYTVPKEALVGGRVAVAGKPRYARILIRNRVGASA